MSGFARKISQLRSEQRMSKSALARAVGVSPTCVWNWEEGNTEPRSDNLAAIARALNTSVEYLEGREGRASLDQNLQPQRIETVAARSLAEIITSSKHEIAAAAGVAQDQVTIKIEY